MRKLKILIGLVLLLLIFSALTPLFSHEETAEVTTLETKTLVNPEAIRLYELQKQALRTALEAYFDKAIASGDIVGAGVSIVKQDSIIISEGFGKKNIKLNNKVDGETVFRLGSLSKGFAGILAATLTNEGKLHWDDKVSDFIPEFHLGNTPNPDRVTLANILSHTSGTPYHSYTNLVEAGMSLRDIAQRFKDVNPISAPGATYSYQNAMFALCEEMMHKVTGKNLSTLLQDRFFKPLDMRTISMDNEALLQTGNVALPHAQSRNQFKTLQLTNKYYNAVAAGGINASALDMAKWMRFLLGHNPEVMDKSAFQEAFNPFIEVGGRSHYYQKWSGHLASYYGYGWRIHKYLEGTSGEEKTIWHHGGSVNNYRNEIALFPEDDLGICVLLNSNSKLAQHVIPDLQKIVNDIYKSKSPELAVNHTDDKGKVVY
jgi:beta-lactamase class C